MKVQKIILLLLLAGAVSQSYAHSKIKMTSAGDQQADLEEVDLQHISLAIRIDAKQKIISGTATIHCIPQKAINHLHLDASSLTINKIQLTGGTVLKFIYDDSAMQKALDITLNKTYKPGEGLVVQIDYRTNHVNETDPFAIGGSNGKGIRFLAPSSVEKSRQPQIWSMGEPEGNSYWFPCKNDLTDLRTTTIAATVDNPFTFISNGICAAKNQNADGTATYTWEVKTPYANHKTAFVIAQYVNYQQQYKQVGLNNYCFPQDMEAVIATTERLPDMMHFFGELTGLDYPYSSYSQAFVQEMPWGIPNMMMATQTENMIDDYPTHKDYLYLWDALEGESLAAQWFGNYVSIKDWSDVWLEKGLSRYVSWMYSEYKNGHDEFLLYQYVTDYFSYKGTWDAGIRIPIVTKEPDDKALLTDPKFSESVYPYFKADLVFHMLRKHLGDERFKHVLRHFIKTHGKSTATTDDFRKSVDIVSGEKMGWFFDQWVYKTGHPVFEVSKKYSSLTKQLFITVKQTQQPDTSASYPQVEYFQGKVDIEVDGKLHTEWIAPKEINAFEIQVTQEPLLVNFDYENTWIKELNFEKPVDEWLYQLNHDNDIMGRYFALSSLVGIVADSSTSSVEKNRIWNGISELLKSDVYWRLKYATLFQVQGLFNAWGGQQAALSFTPGIKKTLQEVAEQNTAWVRATALSVLGMSKDSSLASFYVQFLNDSSERVVNTAAIALGKTKSNMAFEYLVKLKEKPSWKNQSLISALYALTELQDPRAEELAMASCTDSEAAHWTLGTPVWDHRLAAVNTLKAIGKVEMAYQLLKTQFETAIKENNMNDIFYVALQVAMCGAPSGQEVFDKLRIKYAGNTDALAATDGLESQFKSNIKK